LQKGDIIMEERPSLSNGFAANAHSMGLRMTAQRAAVIRVIDETEVHLDAEMIWKRAKAYDPNINLATVYRTLFVLKDMGLIDQRYFARKHKREVYESARKPEHYHFTCKDCGEVFEFETDKITKLRVDLETEFGWRMSHNCLCFEGYCTDCAKEKNTTQ
jgi:Fe2+ or Zn2+ uptake regulation protein